MIESRCFAGIAYGFGGYITAQVTIHQMIVYHIALFPYVAYCFDSRVSFLETCDHCGNRSWNDVLGRTSTVHTLLYIPFWVCFALYELVYRARHKDEKIDLGVLLFGWRCPS